MRCLALPLAMIALCASCCRETTTPKSNASTGLESRQCRATAREKMLLRFILQDEFAKDRGKVGHAETLDSILSEHIKSGNAAIRKSAALSIGTTGWGSQLDPEKARQALREQLSSETDRWVQLELARVLAWFSDDTGKPVLVAALYGQGGYRTSSGIEYRKAIIPLLLLDYEFPNGFPRQAMVWGGLADYLKNEAEKREPNQPDAPDGEDAAGDP